MNFIDDDENVKAMRETARRMGLTDLLMELRQEHVVLLSSMDRHRARLTEVLILIGVGDPERR